MYESIKIDDLINLDLIFRDKFEISDKVLLSKSINITAFMDFVKEEDGDDEEVDLPVFMYGIKIEGTYMDMNSMEEFRKRNITKDYSENKEWNMILPIYIIGDGCMASATASYSRASKFIYTKGLADILKNAIEGYFDRLSENNCNFIPEIKSCGKIYVGMLCWHKRNKETNERDISMFHPICYEYPEAIEEFLQKYPYFKN